MGWTEAMASGGGVRLLIDHRLPRGNIVISICSYWLEGSKGINRLILRVVVATIE